MKNSKINPSNKIYQLPLALDLEAISGFTLTVVCPFLP